MNRSAVAVLAALAVAGLGGPRAVAQPPPGPVTAIVHVDIAPAPPRSGGAAPEASRTMAAARGRSLLLELAAGCSARNGCRRFEVLQQLDRPNHFPLVETWDSRAALDAFEGSDLWRRVHKDLEPMLGSPFDERLHREAR